MANQFDIETVDLGVTRPQSVRILIAQASWAMKQWKEQAGLFFHADISNARRFLNRILAQARQSTVDLVVMPELSVPEDLLKDVQTWSEQTGSTIIAGSHYTKTKKGYISRSPVIISGKVSFTEKITPAPAEISPILGEGLQPGNKVLLFKNTSVGNFSVLICSDYLDNNVKRSLPLEDLDLICVPAFQRDSNMYHSRMNIDCEESLNGFYLTYANTLCDKYGDGRTALFGLMDNLFAEKLEKSGYTNREPPLKVCELKEEQDFVVVDIDLEHKRPFLKRNVHTKPNIQLVQISDTIDRETEKFAQTIGHHDERYARIKEFFVPPREYESLIPILEKSKLLFITGDPGIGKTYTAVHLLRYYFDLGYKPLWYAGIEKSERLNQRVILENFSPRDGQVIYFEDPFGRTVFERRDTIYRTFGPLIDHLKDVNARVIITSRREIFEQFSQETLSSLDLRTFTQELNVVKPSYSPDSLVKILHKLAVTAKWYSSASSRNKVLDQIQNRQLTTPLAIRDFVFSTESIDSEPVLLERLNRRGLEEKELFAEEIQACDTHTKLTLSLVFLFGSQSLSTLANWYNQVATYIDPIKSWTGTAPFFEEIRLQTGYRLEQYGAKAIVIRFIHPYYEEAFAATAEKDLITFDIQFLGKSAQIK